MHDQFARAVENQSSLVQGPALYEQHLKRMFDTLAATAALVVLAPLFAIIALGIRLEDGGPVLFRQRRVGRDGKPFHILKFRSMPINVAELPSARATTLPITRIGQPLRRLNLDELPQLLNILVGDMSIVGPRPALPSQERLVDLRRRNGALGCRPGLTGLAQISGYSGMPDEEKARYDGLYASSVSLVRDLGIMLRTAGYLLRPPPVY